jgi:hypothetical protein
MSFEQVFSFPLAINEKAARTVAAVVAVVGLVAVATGWLWLALPLAYGFWARVLTGPTLSPLGRLASSVVAPRYLGTPKWVAGPPKRFAQAMGAGFTTGASIAWIAGADGVATVLLALLVVAATLEAAFALCLGCKVFAGLMRVGLVPQSVCEACAAPARAG